MATVICDDPNYSKYLSKIAIDTYKNGYIIFVRGTNNWHKISKLMEKKWKIKKI